MVKAIHITDVHENAQKIELAAAIAQKTGAKISYITGDFIGKEHGNSNQQNSLDDRLEAILRDNEKAIKLQERYGIQTQEDLDNLDESTQNEFNQKSQELLQGKAQSIIQETAKSYESLKPSLEKLAKQTKVVGVMGNHDLQIGYKVLEDVVTFAEREKEVKVEGLTIKGAINTNDDEIPGIYGNELVQQVLGRYFVNYAEGSSDMSNEAVAKANKDTYEKLTKTGPADVFLTHVQPEVKFGGNKSPHGQATADYSKIVGGTYSGHKHGGEIILGVDGELHLNPGPNHAFVVEYDNNNKPKAIEIYKLN
jgi:Icc-related predicted phosphoesterase